MKKGVLFVLLLFVLLSQGWAEEFARFYIGSDLRFEPGQGKNAGFGEFHWGGISNTFYGTIEFGVSSKAFLSSVQLKSPDVIKILDSLVQSDSEFYVGAVYDKIFYNRDRESIEGNLEGSAKLKRFYYQSSLAGGPNVEPGWGIGGRLEVIANLVNKKAEKDPSAYLVGSAFVNVYYATNIIAFWPMIGVGINEGLDYHFVNEVGNGIKRAFSPRLKLRIDISSKRTLNLAGTKAQVFLSLQREWPFKKSGTIQLEDGTLAPATKLVDSSLRLGISFDL
jgi:hypothetical protein